MQITVIILQSLVTLLIWDLSGLVESGTIADDVPLIQPALLNAFPLVQPALSTYPVTFYIPLYFIYYAEKSKEICQIDNIDSVCLLSTRGSAGEVDISSSITSTYT